jgi:hypothetical protein
VLRALQRRAKRRRAGGGGWDGSHAVGAGTVLIAIFAGCAVAFIAVLYGYTVKRMIAPSKRSAIPQNSAYERATTLSRR